MAMVTVHENVIWDALREAVEKIKAGLDLEKTKEVCKERLGVGAVNAIEIKDAYTLVHEGQQAIRIKLRFSGDLDMLLDFHGNCISTIQGAPDNPSSPEQRIEQAGYQAGEAHKQF
jgi:hypothetical protein